MPSEAPLGAGHWAWLGTSQEAWAPGPCKPEASVQSGGRQRRKLGPAVEERGARRREVSPDLGRIQEEVAFKDESDQAPRSNHIDRKSRGQLCSQQTVGPVGPGTQCPHSHIVWENRKNKLNLWMKSELIDRAAHCNMWTLFGS